jgi:hypothetical protein
MRNAPIYNDIPFFEAHDVVHTSIVITGVITMFSRCPYWMIHAIDVFEPLNMLTHCRWHILDPSFSRDEKTFYNSDFETSCGEECPRTACCDATIAMTLMVFIRTCTSNVAIQLDTCTWHQDYY